MAAILRREVADFGIRDTMCIQVDIVELSGERLSLIATKLSQAIPVLSARWHYL